MKNIRIFYNIPSDANTRVVKDFSVPGGIYASMKKVASDLCVSAEKIQMMFPKFHEMIICSGNIIANKMNVELPAENSYEIHFRCAYTPPMAQMTEIEIPEYRYITIIFDRPSESGIEKKTVFIDIPIEEYKELESVMEKRWISSTELSTVSSNMDRLMRGEIMDYADGCGLGLKDLDYYSTHYIVALDETWKEETAERLSSIQGEWSENDKAELMAIVDWACVKGDKKEMLYWCNKGLAIGEKRVLTSLATLEQNNGTDESKREIIDQAVEFLKDGKGISVKDMRTFLMMEESMTENEHRIDSTLADMANNGNENALQALGCVCDIKRLEFLVPDEVINIYRESGRLSKGLFIMNFREEEDEFGLETVRNFFKYGVFVEKDEKMLEVIDAAIKRNERRGMHWDTCQLAFGRKDLSNHFKAWLEDMISSDNDIYALYILGNMLWETKEMGVESPLIQDLALRYKDKLLEYFPDVADDLKDDSTEYEEYPF